MIDKKRMIEGLETKILIYENEKKNINNQDKLLTIDFTIRELKYIIKNIEWGFYDAK